MDGMGKTKAIYGLHECFQHLQDKKKGNQNRILRRTKRDFRPILIGANCITLLATLA